MTDSRTEAYVEDLLGHARETLVRYREAFREGFIPDSPSEGIYDHINERNRAGLANIYASARSHERGSESWHLETDVRDYVRRVVALSEQKFEHIAGDAAVHLDGVRSRLDERFTRLHGVVPPPPTRSLAKIVAEHPGPLEVGRVASIAFPVPARAAVRAQSATVSSTANAPTSRSRSTGIQR